MDIDIDVEPLETAHGVSPVSVLTISRTTPPAIILVSIGAKADGFQGLTLCLKEHKEKFQKGRKIRHSHFLPFCKTLWPRIYTFPTKLSYRFSQLLMRLIL